MSPAADRSLLQQLPEAVRRRAASLGADGLSWLAGLDALVLAILAEWRLTPGAVLDGGTEFFVAEVRTADGQSAVLKIGVPGAEAGGREAQVLAAAKGCATLGS